MIEMEKMRIKIEGDSEYGGLYYHILDSMADWVRVVNKEGIVIYANKPMINALGDKLIGSDCDIECKKRYRDKLSCFCTVKESIKKGKVMQKEGIINNRYYSIKSSPVYNLEKDIVGAVEVFRDITREKNLETRLKYKDEKISKELGLAKRIQNKILPKSGIVDDLFIDYIYKPSQVLSGDMFDIYRIDEDNVGIYVSDVAGHGISASMITMFVRQSMRFIKDDILSPSEALSELHQRFKQLNLEKTEYFTIFYGVFNRRTYEFTYANAGHNCVPIKYNGKDIELVEISGYPIFSLFDRIDYKEGSIKLTKGDRILLYTDGITERQNSEGVEFGLKNLLKIIEDTENNLLARVERKILSYGETKDDFAMVMMEVLA